MPSIALPRRRSRLPIIAALLALSLLLLGAAASLRLGYSQGRALVFRWLDGYVDFDDAQSLRVRDALDDWFAWHRRTQLPDYADLLARARGRDAGPRHRRARCAPGATRSRGRFDAAIEHAVPAMAEIAPTLSPQQIASIEKRYAEKNERVPRRVPAAATRRSGRRRRSSARSSAPRCSTAGSTTPQRAFVAERCARSPWDARAWPTPSGCAASRTC